jgi:glutaredoxin
MKNSHSIITRFMLKIAVAFFALSMLGQVHAAKEEKTVVMYGTSWCMYCKETRAYFQKNGIDFTDYDVESSKEIQDKFKALGGAQVPLIFIGKERIQGFNKDEINKALDKAGIKKK